jgi:transcriptional regulator with XRE-family HTH domain
VQKLSASIAADRHRLNLSQEELAKRIGVSQQAVSSWEEGSTMPRSSRLRALVDAFGDQSLTAQVVADMVGGMVGGRSIPSKTTMNHHHFDSDPLSALAQAAKEIARAAMALADAVQKIAEKSTAPPDSHRSDSSH